RRIFWGQAATCARSRNFWGTPLCPRRKSTPPSIACDCLKPIARRIRAGDETLEARRGEDYHSGAIGHIYPVHVTTRKSFGLMTRKLSVTRSRHLRQFLGILSRKKSSVASANCPHVA